MKRQEDDEVDLAALRESEAEFRAAFESAPDAPGPAADLLDVAFDGEVILWRGPAPYYFVRLPGEPAAAVHGVSRIATYGWGCIPVSARIGDSEFGTALFPKDGGYLLPIKAVVRKAEQLEQGDVVPVRMVIRS
jgi:Domain of unknown function (DUF1905)